MNDYVILKSGKRYRLLSEKQDHIVIDFNGKPHRIAIKIAEQIVRYIERNKLLTDK